MGKKKEQLTNAVRICREAGLDPVIHAYDASHGFTDGLSVSAALGIEPERCFKTLVLTGNTGDNFVAILPVNEELDLKKTARHFGLKKIDMLPSREITRVTGYVKGGCSPVGMKKLFPTVISESAGAFDRILVSGGKIGLQMEISPADLAQIVHAEFNDITREGIRLTAENKK